MKKRRTNMILTDEEIQQLCQSGHSHNDIVEIESAAKKTTYNIVEADGRRISIPKEKAIELLGREEWVRGLARSAFYVNTTRYADTGERISFHSRVYR